MTRPVWSNYVLTRFSFFLLPAVVTFRIRYIYHTVIFDWFPSARLRWPLLLLSVSPRTPFSFPLLLLFLFTNCHPPSPSCNTLKLIIQIISVFPVTSQINSNQINLSIHPSITLGCFFFFTRQFRVPCLFSIKSVSQVRSELSFKHARLPRPASLCHLVLFNCLVSLLSIWLSSYLTLAFLSSLSFFFTSTHPSSFWQQHLSFFRQNSNVPPLLENTLCSLSRSTFRTTTQPHNQQWHTLTVEALGSLKRTNFLFNWCANKAPITGCASLNTCTTGLPSNAGSDSTRTLSPRWTASPFLPMRAWWSSAWWTTWASAGLRLLVDWVTAVTTQSRTGGMAAWTASAVVFPLPPPLSRAHLTAAVSRLRIRGRRRWPVLSAVRFSLRRLRGLKSRGSRPQHVTLSRLTRLLTSNSRLSTPSPLSTVLLILLWPRLLSRKLQTPLPWFRTTTRFLLRLLAPFPLLSSCLFLWILASSTAMYDAKVVPKMSA